MGEEPRTDESVHLVVAWAHGKSYSARLVKMSDQVASQLVSDADKTMDGLGAGTPYAPDSDLEDDSHMEAPRDGSLDTALLDELSRGASLDLVTDDELRTKPLICHALIVKRDDAVVIFVRKRSPIHLAKKSMVATLFNGTLDRLEQPLFAFDSSFDVVITKDKVFILDKRSFELLFKTSPAVLSKLNNWIAEVASVVPFTEDSADQLNQILGRNSVLRNKFLAIKGRTYLVDVTTDSLKSEMVKYGLDPADLMEGDFLKITPQNAKDILRLLNEDLFSGGFSSQHYAASSKRSIN